MAHRPMPKPDSAGGKLPVARLPLPIIPKDIISKNDQEHTLDIQCPINAPKRNVFPPSRDYWTLGFAAFLFLVVLLLGWRITTFFWKKTEAVQYQHLGRTVNTPHPATIPKINAKSVQNNLTTKKPSLVSSEATKEKSSSQSEPVIVHVVIGADGKVKEAEVVRGDARFAAATLKTVEQLDFTPYTPHGAAEEFETEVIVSNPNTQKDSLKGIQISIPQATAHSQPSIH
jgi:hypothetical protein